MSISSDSQYRQPRERQATSVPNVNQVEHDAAVAPPLPIDSRDDQSATQLLPSVIDGDSVHADAEHADWSEATIISQKPSAENLAPVAPKRTLGPGMTAVMAAAQVLLGKSLDHFELLELIGGGGMGAVFRARDTRLDRIVAVKVIPATGQDAEMAKRFKVEAQSAARLDHPNIARVYYVGEVNEWSYIVFEYVDGINLRDLVVSKGPLSIDEAVWFTRQVAEALTHASARFVVHRDIKPSNVLVTKRGLVKLVDMGLARTVAMEKTSNDLTASNITLGTFDYISPEQARDPRGADVRSDLYSLGCTLYFLLSGKPPFPDGTAIQKLMMHGNVKPTDIRRLRIDVTDELAAIVNKLMEKNPSQRYQQPIELINDLYLLAEFENLPKSRQAGTVSITPTIEGKTIFESLLPWMVSIGLLCGAILWMQNMHRVSSMIRLPKEKVAFTVTSTANSQSEKTIKDDIATNGVSTSGAKALSNGSVAVAPRVLEAPNSSISATSKLSEPTKVSAPLNSSVGSAGPSLLPVLPNAASVPVNGERFSPFSPLAPVVSADGPGKTGSRASVLDWLNTSRLPSDASATPLSKGPRNDATGSPDDLADNQDDSLEESGLGTTPDPAFCVLVDSSGTFPSDQNWKVARSLQDALLMASAEPQRNQILLIGNVRVTSELTWSHPSLVIRGVGGRRAKIEISLRSESMPTFNSDADEISSGFRLSSQSLQLIDVDLDLYSPESSSGMTSCFEVASGSSVELTRTRVTMLPSISGWRASVFNTLVPAKNTGPMPGSESTNINSLDPMPLASVANEGRILDPVRVSLKNSIVRGTGDFLLQREGQRTEIQWSNGLLAVDGRVIEYAGAKYSSRIPWNIRVQWEDVTAMPKRGFSRMRYSAGVEFPVCLSCVIERCAFVTDIDASFFEFEGVDELNVLKATAQDQAVWTKWLDYRGMDNAYDGDVQEMIRLRSAGKIVARFDFASAIQNILLERAPEPNIRWVNRPNPLVPLHLLEAESFLQRAGNFNAGMEADRLPKLSPAEMSRPEEG